MCIRDSFEVICEAVIILNKLNIKNFRVVLTIDGTENSYSNHILEKYKSVDVYKRQVHNTHVVLSFLIRRL